MNRVLLTVCFLSLLLVSTYASIMPIMAQVREVKFRGVLTEEPYSIPDYFIFEVRVDEILFDPSGFLSVGRIVRVSEMVPKTEEVHMGDRVEVYGLVWLTESYEISISEPSYYLKKYAQPLVITNKGDPSDYPPQAIAGKPYTCVVKWETYNSPSNQIWLGLVDLDVNNVATEAMENVITPGEDHKITMLSTVAPIDRSVWHLKIIAGLSLGQVLDSYEWTATLTTISRDFQNTWKIDFGSMTLEIGTDREVYAVGQAVQIFGKAKAVTEAVSGIFSIRVFDEKGYVRHKYQPDPNGITLSTGDEVKYETTWGMGSGEYLVQFDLSEDGWKVKRTSDGKPIAVSVEIHSGVPTPTPTPMPKPGNLLVKVFDLETRQPIQGVGVHVDGSYRGETDSNGALLVSNLNEGSHLVALSKENYMDKIVEDVRVEAGQTNEVEVYMEPIPGQAELVINFLPKDRYRVGEVGELDVKIKNKGEKTAHDIVVYWSDSIRTEQPIGVGSLGPGQETTVKLRFGVIYEGNGGNEEDSQKIAIERIVWTQDGQTRTATSDEWSIWADTFVDKALGDITDKLHGEKLPSEGVEVGWFETKTIALLHTGKGVFKQISISVFLPWGSRWKITAYTYNEYQWSREIGANWIPGWEVALPDVDVGVITLVFYPLWGFGRFYIDPFLPAGFSLFSLHCLQFAIYCCNQTSQKIPIGNSYCQYDKTRYPGCKHRISSTTE